MQRFTTRTKVDCIAYVVAALLVVSGLVHLGVAAVSQRPWEGPLSWRKPATFGLSFGTTLATVVWTSSYLALRERTRNVLLAVFTVDCVVEVAGITVQAWRDEPSHFNISTPFNASVAYTLAAGGFVLVVVLGTLAVSTFRVAVSGPPSMRLALRAGYLLMMAGLGAGAAMIARGTVLARTGHVDAAYADGGFLKLFHGVTIHAVLVLPVLALLADRVATRRAGTIVRAGVGTYAVAAGGVLAGSLVVAF